VQGLIKGKEGLIRFEEIDITKDREAAKRYKVQATPTLVILDSQGNQTWSYEGVPKEGDLKREIEKVMSSTP
jgi:thioredoxin-related protein